ncbi:hypothetical protein KSP40_PGU005259 [Platanthera guangdongensis]|uniref:RRM domain-containing protein n=1 Tax=Platanthera guangdongensis TaxID=2320717 RepID=A0ABR2LLJ7_9ASPA
MADAYWRFADARQQAAADAPPASLKRPRTDFGDVSGAPEFLGYHPREEDRTVQYVGRDTESISASYNRYMHNGTGSYVIAETAVPVGGGTNIRPISDPHMPNRALGYNSRRTEAPLPPDASNTLFVEGLPANCTSREVSHIFRPFVGFQEVRLVNKESKHSGGDPFVLCFVDFVSPVEAAVALDALQGYKLDEHDQESSCLRIQFARSPGRRSFPGPRR